MSWQDEMRQSIEQSGIMKTGYCKLCEKYAVRIEELEDIVSDLQKTIKDIRLSNDPHCCGQ